MRCFELSFQHCYLPYRWEEAGNGLPGLSKTLGKAAKLEASDRTRDCLLVVVARPVCSVALEND